MIVLLRMFLRKLFIIETGETSAHSLFGSARRHSFWWSAMVLTRRWSSKVHYQWQWGRVGSSHSLFGFSSRQSFGGHYQLHWGRLGSVHSLFRSTGRQKFKGHLLLTLERAQFWTFSVQISSRFRFNKKMVLKRLLIRDTEEASANSLCRCLGRPSWSQYDSLTWKMVLKRPFIGDTGEDCTFTLQVSQRKSSLSGCGGLQGLILNNILFGREWLSWKDWFSTISSSGGCDGLERADFHLFPLGEDLIVLKYWFSIIFILGDVVVLYGQILDYFHSGRVLWSCKRWFWTVLLWDDVVVLKGLVFNDFHMADEVGLKRLILDHSCFGLDFALPNHCLWNHRL